MNRLLARLDDLIAKTTMPSTTDQDLRAFLEDKLVAKAGRAEAARKRTENRSRALRQRIRGDPRRDRGMREEKSGNFGTETTVPFVSNTTYQ